MVDFKVALRGTLRDATPGDGVLASPEQVAQGTAGALVDARLMRGYAVDLSEQVDLATEARDSAVAARDAAVSAAGTVGNYDTLAQANAALSSIPANGGVNVLADGANNGFYVKVGSALVRKSSATLPGVSAVTDRLSRAADVLPPSDEYAHTLQDVAGFFQTYFRVDGAMRNVTGRQDILGMRVVQDTNNWLAITDEAGFVIAMFGPDGVTLPGYDPTPIPVEPSSILPHFSGLLCGIEEQPVSIFLAGLLEDRADVPLSRISILGAGGVTASDAEEVTIKTDKLGPNADLVVRPREWNGGVRAVRSMNVRTAPVVAETPVAKNVLLIGDSIGNRQGAAFLGQYLAEAGYNANFIGTMRGSNSPTAAFDTTGPLGECREGWETGDYTNKVTDRALPIALGQEAAYLAMNKNDQRDRNPFIRAATGSDPASIVRNGYVLDFAFYQSRFSLPTPDVVIYALGTNDIRDRSASIVGQEVYENDMLLLARIRAAWPNARIIRTLPGTARDEVRDPIWKEAYIPVIRGMTRALNELSDPRMVLAPAWAMVCQDGGYSLLPGTVDPVLGVVSSIPDDSIHPIDGNRAALYRALSGYVACAMAEQF